MASHVRIAAISGSLRKGSFNSATLRAAQELAPDDVTVEEVPIRDIPVYDDDVRLAGYPASVEAFRAAIAAADAVLFVTPEYNYSVPGVLKNAIDWVSRAKPQPFSGRHGMLLSASPSMVGGNRGLWALRVPLEHLGARVFPEMFSLAQAHQAFDAEGRIANPQLADRFEQSIVAFMDLVEAAKHYPCAKAKWYEFLGEQPTVATDRAE